MSNQTSIEQRVMANVGVIYTARKIFGPTMLKLYVLALAALAMWRLVWVTRIEQNFLHAVNGGAVSVWNYFVSAVMHTHPSVLITLAIAAAAFAGLMSDLFRSAFTPRQTLSF